MNGNVDKHDILQVLQDRRIEKMEDNSTSADPLSDTTNRSRVDLGSLAPLAFPRIKNIDRQASNSSSKEVDIRKKGGKKYIPLLSWTARTPFPLQPDDKS